MLMRVKHISRLTALMMCGLLLVPLLVACGGGGSSNTTPVNASAATPLASSSTTTSIAMSTLAGNGFIISYPQTWKISRSGTHLVTFESTTSTAKMTITIIPDPNGSISADSLANSNVKVATTVLTNVQTKAVPATTTVGGQSWVQKSVSGTQRLNNQNSILEVVVLSTIHPSNTPLSKGYTISYLAAQPTFNQTNTTYFQPMLQSFHFQ